MSDEAKIATPATPVEAPTKKPKITIEDQIREIAGVLDMRRAIYPQYVISFAGAPPRMSQAEADLRIANTEAALVTLKLVQEHAGALRSAIAAKKKEAKNGPEVHEQGKGDGSTP